MMQFQYPSIILLLFLCFHFTYSNDQYVYRFALFYRWDHYLEVYLIIVVYCVSPEDCGVCILLKYYV